MAFDGFYKISNFNDFLPSFTKQSVKLGAQKDVDEAIKHLDALIATHDYAAHSFILKRIVKLREIYGPLDVNVSDCVQITVKLWQLFSEKAEPLVRRLRIGNALLNLLVSIHNDHGHPIWMREGSSVLALSKADVDQLASIPWRALFDEIIAQYSYAYRSAIGTSPKRRRALVRLEINMVSCLRGFWDAEELGASLEAYVDSHLNIHSEDIFLTFRLLHSFCPAEYCYKLVRSGKLFEWWKLNNGSAVNSWDAMFASLLTRGVRYGWAATGKPLNAYVQPCLPFLFQILLREIKLPSRVAVKNFTESIPRQMGPLLHKKIELPSILGKLCAYLIEPNEEQSLFSLSATNESSSADQQDSSNDGISSSFPSILKFLEALINTVFPYAHPSNDGKWSAGVSMFFGAFITSYCRRAMRERHGDDIITDVCARCFEDSGDSGDTSSRKLLKDLRLTAECDEKVADLLLPLFMQAIHSRQPGVLHSAEDSMKRLCALAPGRTLEVVFERLEESLLGVTETGQQYGALRLLAQLSPLIVKYTPHLLPNILTCAIPGIDSSDPVKTVKTLTLYGMFFSYIPCFDASSAYFEEDKLAAYLQKYKDSMHTTGFLRLEDLKKADKDDVITETPTDYHIKTFVSEEVPFRQFMITNYPHPSKSAAKVSLEESYCTLEGFAEIIRNRQMASSLLPSHARIWFDQILGIIEHTSSSKDKVSSLMTTVENAIAMLIYATFNSVLTQLAARDVAPLMDTFSDWLSSNILPDAAKLCGTIAHALTDADPESSLKVLFPLLYNKLVDESSASSSNAPSTLRKHMQAEHVVWYTQCLAGLVRNAESSLLKYSGKLNGLIEACFASNSKKVFGCGAKLFKRCLECHMGVYLRRRNCLSSEIWETEENCDDFILSWGSPWWMNSKLLSLEWHIPSENEMKAAEVLIDMGLKTIYLFLKHSIPSSFLERFFASKTSQDGSLEKALSDVKVGIESSGSLTEDTAKNPPVALLTRSLLLGRSLLKSISCLFPDERKSDDPDAVVLTLHENIWGSYVAERIAISVGLAFKAVTGISVSPKEDVCSYTRPELEVHGLEESGLLKQLLKTSEEVLLRHSYNHSRSSNLKEDAQSFVSWASTCAGVRALSHWQDLTRGWWEELVNMAWIQRIDARRERHEVKGFRREILFLVATMSVYHYAEVRKQAQEILSNSYKCHNNARSRVSKFLFSIAEEEFAKSDSALVSFKGCNSSGSKTTDASESANSDEDEFRVNLKNERMTGLAYYMNSSGTFSEILQNNVMLGRASAIFCNSLLMKFDKDTVHKRWVSAVCNFMSNRTTPVRNDAFKTHVLQGFIMPLLDALHSQEFHWHFVLVATSFLISYNSPHIPECLEAYSLWLLKICDSSQHRSSVVSLGTFALALLFKEFTRKYDKLPEKFVAELEKPQTIRTLFKCLEHSSHKLAKGGSLGYLDDGGDGGTDGATLDHLPGELLELTKIWPLNRVARSSNQLSIHNLLFVKSFFSYLHFSRKMGQTPGSPVIDESILQVLKELNEEPNREVDAHAAFLEISFGLIRASRKWSEDVRRTMWTELFSLLRAEFLKSDLIILHCFMDGSRFSLQGTRSPEDIAVFMPLFNLVIALQYNKESLGQLMPFPPVTTFDSSSTFDFTKRLRAVSAILMESLWNEESLIVHSVNLLKEIFEHQYVQIRSEAARLLHCIQGITTFFDCPAHIKQYGQIVRHYMTDIGTQLTDFVNSDTSTAQEGAEVPVELRKAETVILSLTKLYVMQEARGIFEETIALLPFLFACSKHPNVKISESAIRVIYRFCVSSVHSELLDETREEMIRRLGASRLAKNLLQVLETFKENESWRVRKLVMEICEFLGYTLMMYLNRSKDMGAILDICIVGLQDSYAEVSGAAKTALSCLFVNCHNSDSLRFTELFAVFAGRYNASMRKEDFPKALAGILGLSALVQASPYHVPGWLPNTITVLARYGNAKMPDVFRKHIEKCLQEFYRTHQDAWRQLHMKKFTESQLEMLEMYKGKPIYFS